jgi:hypothetical protein
MKTILCLFVVMAIAVSVKACIEAYFKAISYVKE